MEGWNGGASRAEEWRNGNVMTTDVATMQDVRMERESMCSSKKFQQCNLLRNQNGS